MRQQFIKGAYDPVDQQVAEAVEAFVQLTAALEKAQDRVARAKQQLIEAMEERDLQVVVVNGYRVTRTHKEVDKLKLTKVPTIEVKD